MLSHPTVNCPTPSWKNYLVGHLQPFAGLKNWGVSQCPTV